MSIKKIGRYEVLAQVGRGAMGTVYRARDPVIDRIVAIKTLNPDVAAESLAEIKERFLREARAAGKLTHPNIVTVYDVGEDAGVAYIAMEFLDGQSLRQLLDSGGRLTYDDIAGIAAQIADALDYAQRVGIVHRDVKPANIMLVADGVAKLADFGVAYTPASSVTMTGMIVGSPKYLSPEQVLGSPVDGRADIFALGIVLYEMLAGRTPFDGPDVSVFSLMHRLVSDPAEPISSVNPDAPGAFDLILKRALAKRPEDRHPSARDFAHELRNYRQLASPPAEPAAAVSGDETVVAPVAHDLGSISTPRMAPPRRAATSDPSYDESMARLLQDIERFSREFDERHTRTPAAGNEQPQGSGVQVATPVQQPKVHVQPVAPASSEGDRTGTKRRLLEMLREQAEAKERSTAARPSLEAMVDLSRRIRQAALYLTEFVAEFNRATPAFSGALRLLYVRELPPLALGGGFVDYRTRKAVDKELMDYIRLTYRMMADTPVNVQLNRDDARLLKAHLQRASLPYEEQDTKNATGRVPHVALTIPCDISSMATMRPNYDTLAVLIECRNVGLLGPARYRIESADFDEATMEEFGKLLLGLPNDFRMYRYTER
jgi:serine/threonine protein kinase